MALLVSGGKPIYQDGRDQKEEWYQGQREIEGGSAIYKAIGYSEQCYAGANGEWHKGLRIQRLNAEQQGRYGGVAGLARQLNGADEAESARESQRERVSKELQWPDRDGNEGR